MPSLNLVRSIGGTRISGGSLPVCSQIAETIKNAGPAPFGGRNVEVLPDSTFSEDAYFSKRTLIRALRFLGCPGSILVTASTLTSTNALTQNEWRRVPPGVTVVADEQTRGRGRGKNTWVSPVGSLCATFVVAVARENLLTLQYAAALAVVEAIKDIDGKCNVAAKWPNDIYTRDNVKIGGILCQTSTPALPNGDFRCAIGIGLNVHNEQPTVSLASLVAPSARPLVTRERVLAAIADRLTHRLSDLFRGGFNAISKAYHSQWMHSNQSITVKADATGSDQDVPVVLSHVRADGTLVGMTEAGEEVLLDPDGSTVDLLQCLIMRKEN